MTTRVLHLTGSPTSEFHADLSRLYARDCLRNAADPARYEFLVADVSPGGRWRFPADLSPAALDAAPPVGVAGAVDTIAGLGVDVALPQLFCVPGMTAYRGLLDVLGIPYVGNTGDVMALAAHKARARAVVAAAGVAVPRGEVLRRGERPTLTPPVVVKPVDADNSLGVSFVADAAGFDTAIEEALAHADAVLVEDYVELGREVRCGLVESGGELVGLPLEEYRMDDIAKPVRGPDDKLARGDDGDLALQAKDGLRAWMVEESDPATAVVHEAARAAYTAMGCRHYGLFDFRLDPEGRPWFLEASLYNSFARQSVVTMMAGAAGITLPELFGRAVEQCLGVTPAPR